MASVNYSNGKHKTSTEAKAQFRHSLTDERLKKNHSNADIDKTRTHLNFSLYDLSYKELCEKYDNRIAELDSTTNTNKRKDRVTCFCLNVPAPERLQEDDLRQWFGRVVDLMKDQYGNDNLLEMVVHLDEIHSYVDAETKEDKESRSHAHCYLTPEHQGSLNGKWFSSRSNMTKLNNAIQRMSEDEFGVDFMTGSKKKSIDKVEDLKIKSVREEVRKLQTNKSKLNAENNKVQVSINSLKQEEKELYDTVLSLRSEVGDLKALSDAVDAYKKATEKVEEEEDPFMVQYMRRDIRKIKDKQGNVKETNTYDRYKNSKGYSDRQKQMQMQLQNQQLEMQRNNAIARSSGRLPFDFGISSSNDDYDNFMP